MTVSDGLFTAAIVAFICVVFYICWLALDRLETSLGRLFPGKRGSLKGACYDCGADSDDCVLDEISYGNAQLFCRECASKHWPSGESEACAMFAESNEPGDARELPDASVANGNNDAATP